MDVVALLEGKPDDMSQEDFDILEAKILEASAKRAAEFPTTDEGIEAFLNTMPLLSTARPEEGSDAFAALDSFAGETPALERAENFKNSGNQAIKLAKQLKDPAKRARRFRDAVVYYAQALEAKSGDNELDSIINSNRAMASLELTNYGRARDDCVQAISLDPSNLKAYYRAATANKHLKNFKQALIFINHGLAHCKEGDAKHKVQKKALLTLQKDVAGLKEEAAHQKKVREKKDTVKVQAKAVAKSKVEMARMERQIELSPPMFDMSTFEGYKAKPFLDDENNLHWPVLILYEDEMQSDFIRDFHEHTTFVSQLKLVMPPKASYAPWDTDKKYRLNRIKVTYDYCGGRSEVNLKDSLAHIINNRDPPLAIPHIPTFFVTLKS